MWQPYIGKKMIKRNVRAAGAGAAVTVESLTNLQNHTDCWFLAHPKLAKHPLKGSSSTRAILMNIFQQFSLVLIWLHSHFD
jgi:hypothetical protein